MAQDYTVPFSTLVFRLLMRPVFRGIFHLLSHVRVSGKENVPADGAYMITINHVSLFEPPFVLAFWPTAPEAVGAVDIWQRPGQSTLARLYGGIQVHRGEYDRQLIDTMLAVLRSGRPLLIAPEGGRSHTPGLRQGQPGVTYIVEKACVPVVPVGIVGTTDDFLSRSLHGERPHLEMRIGKPFKLPSAQATGEARRALRQQNTDLIMTRIAELLPETYRGIYAQSSQSPAEATQ